MRFEIALLAGVAALTPAVVQAAQPLTQRFHEDHVLGTSLDVTVVAESPAAAMLAHAAVKSEIARLDRVLSTWRADSEISALNASVAPRQVSSDLQAVITAAELWSARSDGAFSARLGAVEAAWRAAQLGSAAPSPDQLSQLAANARSAALTVEPSGKVTRPADVVLAVDGIAKGYIIDAAIKAGRDAAPGVRGLMVDIGGDMRCSGQSPQGGAWTIGVAAPGAADNAAPVELLALSDMAVATSGAGKRDLVIDGCTYAHTLNPLTGLAVDTASVTVVAERAADADALASALSVLPPAAGLSLVERTKGAEARIVTADGVKQTSSGWSNLLLRPLSAAELQACATAPATKAWPSDFTVKIGYTIPQTGQGWSKAPFVVIWITDQDGKIVRTLFHLGDRPARFLDSNYVWYRAFTSQTPNLWGSVTRPSRAPGKYDVEWDGKDDSGKPVSQGEYTINIEASREHGGHNIQQIKLTLADTPQDAASPAAGELGATTVKYGK